MAFVKYHKFQVGDTVVTNNIVRNINGWFEIGTIMTITNVHSNYTFDVIDDEGNKAENLTWNDIRLFENNYTRYRDKISKLKREIHSVIKYGSNIEINQNALECLYKSEKLLDETENIVSEYCK